MPTSTRRFSPPLDLLPGRRVAIGAAELTGTVACAHLESWPDPGNDRWIYTVLLDDGRQTERSIAQLQPVREHPALIPETFEVRGHLAAFLAGEPGPAADLPGAVAPPAGSATQQWKGYAERLVAQVNERMRQARLAHCRVAWDEDGDVVGCAFHIEPGYRVCGHHLQHLPVDHQPNAERAKRRVRPVTLTGLWARRAHRDYVAHLISVAVNDALNLWDQPRPMPGSLLHEKVTQQLHRAGLDHTDFCDPYITAEVDHATAGGRIRRVRLDGGAPGYLPGDTVIVTT